jgi:hypothetical protein
MLKNYFAEVVEAMFQGVERQCKMSKKTTLVKSMVMFNDVEMPYELIFCIKKH